MTTIEEKKPEPPSWVMGAIGAMKKEDQDKATSDIAEFAARMWIEGYNEAYREVNRKLKEYRIKNGLL